MATGEGARLGSFDVHNIWIRDLNLVDDVMGRMSFTELAYFVVSGQRPTEREVRLLDATLVSMVEHGLTPSAMVARVTASLSPGSIQGAVSAGLLGIGDVVLGSMEGAAHLLGELEARQVGGAGDPVGEVVDAWLESGRRIPGIGHPIHVEGDPRARRLREIALEHEFPTWRLDLMDSIAEYAGERAGRHLPVNVTGYAAATLLELGLSWDLQRGFALMARLPGLVAHIGEERTDPITPSVRGFLRSAYGDVSHSERRGAK